MAALRTATRLITVVSLVSHREATVVHNRFADLIGIPFKYKGRGPSAYDCYGLLRKLYADDGIAIPDYDSPTDGARIAAMMMSQLHLWREVGEPAPGVTALFKVPGNTHVGYCIDDKKFIHTWQASHGVCIEPLEHWKHRLMGYYRYVG
jgi:cell wall-associated NlpC family hydrolase